jgi:hypothetical protein
MIPTATEFGHCPSSVGHCVSDIIPNFQGAPIDWLAKVIAATPQVNPKNANCFRKDLFIKNLLKKVFNASEIRTVFARFVLKI